MQNFSILNPERALVKSGGTLLGSWNKEGRFKGPEKKKHLSSSGLSPGNSRVFFDRFNFWGSLESRWSLSLLNSSSGGGLLAAVEGS